MKIKSKKNLGNLRIIGKNRNFGGMKAVIIIDMQRDFVEPGRPLCVAGAAETVPACVRLLDHARRNGWPVIHVIRRHDPDGRDCEPYRRHLFQGGQGYCVKGTDGAEIVEPLAPQPGDHIVVKKRFSGFYKTGLDALLEKLGITGLIIAGTQYPNCVRATAVDAQMRDLPVTICTDCCSAQDTDTAAANICDLRAMAIPCLPLAEILKMSE